MKRVDPIAIYVIAGLIFLIGMAALLTKGGVKHLDYKSGIIRDQRSVFGVHYSTHYTETWIAQTSLPSPDPDWGLLGYHGGFFLTRARINTKAARLLSDLFQLDLYLTHAGANDETKQLVAEWALRIIHDVNTDRDQFVAAVKAFECFFDELPFPDDLNNPVTDQQVLDTIAKCEQAE